MTVDIPNKNDFKLDKIPKKLLVRAFSENPNGFCDILIGDLCLDALIFNTIAVIDTVYIRN